jgi:hypothetical protein
MTALIMVPPSAEAASRPDFKMSDLLSRTQITFTVPQGIADGEASVFLSYRAKQSNTLKLTVHTKPPTPFLPEIRIGGLPEGLTPAELSVPLTRFEVGSSTGIFVMPLVDPDEAGNSILVTFRQGNIVRETKATIRFIEPRQHKTEFGFVMSEERFEVRVTVPKELVPGEATMEVRLQASGHSGDSASTRITIVDSKRAAENPEGVAPRIQGLSTRRVGVGQALEIYVDRGRSLGPDPSGAVAVIEQEGRLYSIVPELNSAAAKVGGKDGPVVIIVRPTAEITGLVNVRVLSSARRDYGLSNPLTLEIVDSVVAPNLTKVAETTTDELVLLNRTSYSPLPGGRAPCGYDPDSRFITIRADSLDYRPDFIRISVEQGGEKLVLGLEDVCFAGSDVRIVRLPSSVSAGPAKITIQNLVGDRLSEPVSRELRITRSQNR